MANIAIVNYCNLKCKYCFADDMIQEKTVSIDMDSFRQILQFTSRTPDNHIGIIGGEPTLHPDFSEILKEVNIYCRECNTGATLFTNGIELERYLPEIGDRIGLLININGPEYQGTEKYNKMMKTLDKLNELSWFDRKANCGINIHPGQTDYSFILDIVDKYKLEHLRCSVVSPAASYEIYRSDKEGYYAMMKPIFLDFCEEALKHHIVLNMDCGHIPLCYFTREERELVDKATRNYTTGFCEPVVDITPEFKATACFGSYDPVDIRDFDNLPELRRYLLLKKNYPKSKANCTGKCTTCKKHEILQCQGGCLGFADLDNLEE